MKTAFKWYFQPKDDEINSIWEKGILTVDANVLLDLYRYHENTRNSLISSLEHFKGRLWITHQAATEFFRNRNKVIVSSTKGFKQAADEVSKLRKSFQGTLEQLQGNRIIPTTIVEEMSSTINAILQSVDKGIDEASKDFPDYLKNDPVLTRLLEMFDGAVGKGFEESEMKDIKAIALQRKKDHIPPGYMDDDKDGDRPFGDYFLWRQILDYAKEKCTPMIFVTSERKEDWWEKPSGQTIGPRYELQNEAYAYAQQRVLIYQTDRFLQFASERTGHKIDASAVEEIRAIDSIRSGSLVNVAAHMIESSTPSLNQGQLITELKKPAFKFTASGHFVPQMENVPILTVRLVEAPQGTPEHMLRAGTGTNHDFNIHLKSTEFGVFLPTGKYIFEYVAKCEIEPNKIIGTQSGIIKE